LVVREQVVGGRKVAGETKRRVVVQRRVEVRRRRVVVGEKEAAFRKVVEEELHGEGGREWRRAEERVGQRVEEKC
jgi:hypothetical protein